MFAFFPTQPPIACLEMWPGIVERGILAFKNQPIVFSSLCCLVTSV